ncbi:family 1 glycosylhydrolase [candidate division KSB1 bacterium]|nr:family 1 glycosylhydrolase [candidate division KSB1 bacterium]
MSHNISRREFKNVRTEDFVNHQGEVNDEYRIEYTYKHLKMCQQAMAEGVNLIGYTNWSFLDDYEWGSFGRMGIGVCRF